MACALGSSCVIWAASRAPPKPEDAGDSVPQGTAGSSPCARRGRGRRALLSVLSSIRSPCLSCHVGSDQAPDSCHLRPRRACHGARSVMRWGCPRGRRGHWCVPRRCLLPDFVIWEVTRALDIKRPDHMLPLKTGPPLSSVTTGARGGRPRPRGRPALSRLSVALEEPTREASRMPP